MREWSADVEVDERPARRLTGGRFPEVELASLRVLGDVVWLVGERWAFRFPRRRIAIPGVARELAVLPLALCLCAALASYAHAEGVASVEREALEGLERAVA